MPRYVFEDEEAPKEASVAPKEKKTRYEFVDDTQSKNDSDLLDRVFKYIDETGQDIHQQSSKHLLKGALGSYGDILDLAGLQSSRRRPGERIREQAEFEASPRELAGIVEADEPIPTYSRLPSSHQIGEIVEKASGIGEAKTGPGRYAGRVTQNIGGGAAFGAPAIAASVAAGTVGQALEDMGAPGWMQAIGEIATFLKTNKSPRNLTSDSKQVNEELKRLRGLGYTEEELTLAKNALEDRGMLKKSSKYTEAAEKKFQDVYKSSETKVGDIINDAFPGLKEEGLSGLQKASGELFDSLDDLAKAVVIEKPGKFVQKIDEIIERFGQTLANTPEEKAVMNLLQEAKAAAIAGRPGDVYTRFYKGLNNIGRWGSPKEREYVFSQVKNAIKDTFRENGPAGKKLAKSLEEANESYVKLLRAQDATELMAKATGQEGMNFHKLSSLMDNPSNMKTMVQAVGAKQAENIRQIAKTTDSIKGLQKTMQGGEYKKALGAGKLGSMAYSVFTGDFRPLIGVLGVETAGRLSTQLLTNPKFQNMHLKMLHALKNNQWNSLRLIAQQMSDDLEDMR